MARTSSQITSTAIGVGVATGLYGISFGALATSAGLDLLQTQVLSLLMFSGGSQFAFIGVFATGGVSTLPSAITSAWLLGVRNGFYAVRMAPILQVAGIRRILAAQLTIDESTAVAIAQSNQGEQRKGFWLTGMSVFVFWNLLTLLGALLGQSIGDPNEFGLDAAASAAFLALLWPRLRERQAAAVAALSLIIAVSVSPFLPAGMPILVAGLVAVIIGLGNWFSSRGEVS